MARTSDGWPQFIKTFDEWRERKAGQGSGKRTPPPEWQPDPAWPAPPAGWPLQVDETPASPHRAMDSAWAIAGGTAVFLGSLLPFVSFSDPGIAVNPGARAATALFGLIVLGLGIALRAVQGRFLMGTSVATLCLSALGALGYAITIVAGMAGITEQDPLGYSVTVTFSPGIGILLALAGCAGAGVGAVRFFMHRQN
jgi:hypothetical protein